MKPHTKSCQICSFQSLVFIKFPKEPRAHIKVKIPPLFCPLAQVTDGAVTGEGSPFGCPGMAPPARWAPRWQRGAWGKELDGVGLCGARSVAHVHLGLVTAQIPRSAATSTHSHVTALQRALHQCLRSPLWFPRRRQWHPTPVLLPGKSHGRRSLESCSPWGR